MTQKAKQIRLVRTPYNREEHPYTGQNFTQKSQTVPNQALSMRELLTKYAHGQPLTGGKFIPEYGGEEMDGINMRTLDLTELQELAEKSTETINKFKKEQQNAEKAALKAQEQQRIDEEVEKRLAEKGKIIEPKTDEKH